jgi:thiol:disulfide interchange protein DsbD
MTERGPGRAILLAGLVALLAGPSLPAAPAGKERPQHIKFTVTAVPEDPFSDANRPDGKGAFRPGEIVVLRIAGVPGPGWHTYPITKEKLAPGQPDINLGKVTVTGDAVAALWPAEDDKPEIKNGPFGPEAEYDKPFVWKQRVLIRPDASPGKPAEVRVVLNLQVCSESCIFEDYTLTVSLPIAKADPDAAPPKLDPETEKLLKDFDARNKKTGPDKPSPGEKTPTPAGTFDWQALEIIEGEDLIGEASKDAGLWKTLITALLGGLVSLLTPCVFPMIPVTVSFFIKQGEKQQRSALLLALVYSGTIVVVLTAGGIALVSALNPISQHWATNVLLTGVFIFFGLSLLGGYDIQLPSGLANAFGSRQGGGLGGVVFMALTFSVISFACVGPIYGGFITLEATNPSGGEGWLKRMLAPLAFSVAFAAPFFVLALFPSLLKKLPKSGSWMNSVKVVMGFLELAAAFKFIRAAELNFLHKTEYFSFDLVLGSYVAIAVACGLYLLGFYRLPHDHDAPETIGVARLLFSMTFLAVALYLLPGLFKDAKGKGQRPTGALYAWVESFLLPEPTDKQTDLGAAIAQAQREGKPLFLDFTGLA